jgi:hypothetical protein
MEMLLDDVRPNWWDCEIVARTAKDGKRKLLENKGKLTKLYLDHDLGCKENGHDILVWALYNGLVPPKVKLITANWYGQINMARALRANGYHDLGFESEEFILDKEEK